ncbi:MAG: NUDIX hydrolase [Clostridium sp.]
MGYIMDLRRELKDECRPLIMAAAGVLIINKEGEILLQQRTDNLKWGIPGGAMELGETFEEAAIREAYEEVRIKVKSLELFNVYSGQECFNTYPNGHQVYNASAIFISSNYEGEIVLDEEESYDARFFKVEEFPSIEEINPPDRIVIRDIIQNISINKYL